MTPLKLSEVWPKNLQQLIFALSELLKFSCRTSSLSVSLHSRIQNPVACRSDGVILGISSR